MYLRNKNIILGHKNMLNKLLIIYFFFLGNFLFTILKAEDKTFSYTGSLQTWTVPDGVSSIEVDGYGGMGGHGSSSWNGRGGFGGRLQATISVTAGNTINIYVGEKGGNTKVAGGTTYEPVHNPWTVGDAEGGWNGGGDPGNTNNGGGGGGATDIRIGGTALSDRVYVAGGGGGGGVQRRSTQPGGDGGHGGGTTGANGSTGGAGGTNQSDSSLTRGPNGHGNSGATGGSGGGSSAGGSGGSI